MTHLFQKDRTVTSGTRISNSFLFLVTHWHRFLDVCNRALPITRTSTLERTVWLTLPASQPAGAGLRDPNQLGVEELDKLLVQQSHFAAGIPAVLF